MSVAATRQLCEEVESLLAYESSAKEFMETPAFEVAAKQMAGDEASENQADPVAIGRDAATLPDSGEIRQRRHGCRLQG